MCDMLPGIKRVIVLTHGINNTVEEAKWLDRMKAKLDHAVYSKKLGNEVEVLIHRWNPFFLKFFTFLPVISRRWRSSQVTKFQKYIAWVRKVYGPSVEIDVVAHSFGTYKTHYSMTLDSNQPKAFYRKLVLIAPAVTSRFRPIDAAGHFTEEHYFYSEEDSVIANSPIGNAGWIGPYYADSKRIFAHDYTPVDHSGYFEGELWDKFVDHVVEILDLT